MPTKPESRKKRSTEQQRSTEELRDAVTEVFDAISDWRDDIASTTERHLDDVFERLAVASRSMGWPDEFVDASQQQIRAITDNQLQMVDQVMDALEQHIRSAGATSSARGLGKGSPFQARAAAPVSREAGEMMMAPVQFWMQTAEMWQKSWQQPLYFWTDMQKAVAQSVSRTDGR